MRLAGRSVVADAPADRLAVLRILIGGFAVWYLWTRYDMLVEMAATDPALFDPVGAVAFLDAPLPPTLYHALVVAALVAGGLFILGVHYRVVGPLFGVLLLVVMSYRNSWSMVYHSRNLVVLHTLILGFVPAADALSWDAWRGRVNEGKDLLSFGRIRSLAGDRAYGWPIGLICTVTALTYFLAGVAKVVGPMGWAWAGGASLRGQIAVDALRKEVLGSTASPMAFELYDQILLFTAVGVGTLLIEVAAPVVLAHRRLSWGWAVGAWAMHWGIFFIMTIRFRYQLTGIIFASFLPVERPVRWVRRRLVAAWSGRGAVPAPAREPRGGEWVSPSPGSR